VTARGPQRLRRAIPRGPISAELLAEVLHDQWKASGLTQDEFAARRYQISGQAFRLWLAGKNLSHYIDFLEGMRTASAELWCADNQACAASLP